MAAPKEDAKGEVNPHLVVKQRIDFGPYPKDRKRRQVDPKKSPPKPNPPIHPCG